jgi:hypothetical protein
MKNRFIAGILAATLLLLAGLLWLDRSETGSRAPDELLAFSAGSPPHFAGANPSGGDSLPPLEVTDLPLVVFDNTCQSSQRADLSQCTGLLSGGEVREYRLSLNGPVRSLQIELEPRDPNLDLSFAVFDSQGRCRASGDEQPAGWTERTILARLEAGVYRLVVGGYADHCGPYLLTVRTPDAPVAQVAKSAVRRGPNGSAIRWTSFGEVDLAHFSLYRVASGDRCRIATFRGHGGAARFGEYRYLDRERNVDAAYEIEAVSRDGRKELFSVG